MSCISQAVADSQTETGNRITAAGCLIELARALGPTPAGAQPLQKSISILPTCHTISTLVSYYIQQTAYNAALSIVTELVNLIEVIAGTAVTGNYRTLLHKCEVNRVLLLLILQPTPQRLSHDLAEVLEKYAWVKDSVSVGNIFRHNWLRGPVRTFS